MRQIFEDLALYATTAEEMAVALNKVAVGDLVPSEKLVERAKLWGTDLRHGWNEVPVCQPACLHVCGCSDKAFAF